MKISEAFLVNTKNFDAIIEALVQLDDPNPTINTTLLGDMGFSDPNDLLVVRILKELDIITIDGEPGNLFDEFANPETTKLALARGLVQAYEPLFEQTPSIHHKAPEKVREEFQIIFEGKKTDLIIKYISGTFVKIVSYCGTSLIDQVLSELSDTVVDSEVISDNSQAESTADTYSNGSHSNHSKPNNGIDHNFFETIGRSSVDDILDKFDHTRLSTDEEGTSSVEEEPQRENNMNSLNDLNDDDFLNDFISDDEDFTVKRVQPQREEDKQQESENPSNATDNNKIEEKITKEPDSSDDPFGEELFGDDPFGEETKKKDPVKEEEPISKVGSDDENDEEELEQIEDTLVDDSFEPASVEKPSDKNQELIQQATVRKAELLYKLQRWEDLVPALNQLIKKYENTGDSKLADVVSKSVIRRATALLKLKRTEEAIPALDAVVNRLQDSDTKEYYNQASLAMLYKVQLLEKTGTESAELLPHYNKIINRLDGNPDQSIREKVDAIHFKRFDLIIEKGDKQEVLKASTQLVNRFRNNSENPEYLKLAMIKRAEILEEMNRDEEALEAYEEFLSTFG